MDLQPHQQRVVFEKNDLDGKIERLTMFMHEAPDLFNNLPDAEKMRLARQAKAMCEYRDVLDERIAAFTA